MTLTTPVTDQRTRILDAALELMSAQGSAACSMRQLATACNLNVATLYHYFPSKADLLRSVIEERQYGERLASETPPLDLTKPPRERLASFLTWLWANALDEEAVWRLLVGEGVRREKTAVATTAELVDALALALEHWMQVGFPEANDPAVLARIIRGQVFAFVVEHLALGEVSSTAAATRAEEFASVVFP